MKLGLVTLASLLAGCGLIHVNGPGGTTTPGDSSAASTTGASASGPASASATEAWRGAQRKFEKELESLHYFATTASIKETASSQYIDEALALLQKHAYDELKTECAKGTYKGERDGDSFGHEYMHAATLCPEVAKSDEILKKFIRGGADAYAAYQVNDGFRSELKKLQTTQTIAIDVVVGSGGTSDAEKKRVTSFVQKYYDALGEPVPPTIFASIDTQAAERTKAIQEAAAKGTIEPVASRDAAAEKAISDTYTSRYPKIRILKVWMTDPSWRIIDDNGLILRRAKNAAVLVKAKDGTYCAVVPASVGQKYAGGGNYASTIGVDEFLEGNVVRCP